MKKLLFFTIFILNITILQAQNLVWAKSMGGSINDEGYSIAVDASGNVYTTGSFTGTSDFDPGPGTFTLNSTSNVTGDIFVSKLDASGNFVWAKQFGGPLNDLGYSIAVDGSGNVYTTGSFYDVADFDPGAGSFTLGIIGTSCDIFVSKLDASGNFVWAKQLGGSSNEEGLSITLDASGNVYTTGLFRSVADFDPGAATFNLTAAGSSGVVTDIFVSKLDASGNFVWAKKMGGASNDSGNSIAVDGSGNVYTTGFFALSADFDPGAGSFSLTTTGLFDIFVSKLDASGNFVWAKQFTGNGSNANKGNSIAVDASGNVYTTGSFFDVVDFDPGAGTSTLTTSGSTGDIYVSKLDASGNFVWAKQMGGTNTDAGNSIALDGSGNIYTTGSFYGTADFDPGAGTYTLNASGANHIFMSKLNASGNFDWAMNIGAGFGDMGNSIETDGSGNVYATGYFKGNADFDPTPATYTLNWVGDHDSFVLKMKSCAAPSLSITTTHTILCFEETATLTASGASTYTWNPGGTGASISVTQTAVVTYSIVGTSTAGCVNSSTFTQNVASCTGIYEMKNESSALNIYPNPFENKFTVIGSIDSPIQIFNTLGSLVYHGSVENEPKEVDMSGLPDGIYMLRVGSFTKKIIKD